jgi:hypothetical protein
MCCGNWPPDLATHESEREHARHLPPTADAGLYTNTASNSRTSSGDLVELNSSAFHCPSIIWQPEMLLGFEGGYFGVAV